MKTRHLLIASTLLNTVLLAVSGYYWWSTQSGLNVVPPASLAARPIFASNVSAPVAISPPKITAAQPSTEAPISQADTPPVSALTAPFDQPARPVRTNYQSALAINGLSAPARPAISVPSSPSSAGDLSPGDSQAVDSSRPGNSFRSHGVRVAVAESISSNGAAAAPALGLDLTPEASDASGRQAASRDSSGQNSILPAVNTSAEASSANQGRTSPGTSGVSGATTVSRGLQSALAANSDADPDDRSRDGFTREEELFRAKWGWAAFDAARTEARKQAESQAAQ